MDDRRVAEADVHGGGSLDAFERAVQRLQPVFARLLRARLHVRLVDLHDIGACRKQVPNLLVHRGRVIHRRFLRRLVEVVLRLLRYGEGAGNRNFYLSVGVPFKEL